MQKGTNRLGASALVASLASLVGCATQYNTNVSSSIKADKFSDRNFDIARSQVNLPNGSYVFGRFLENTEVYDESGKLVDKNTLAPFWGIKTNEMMEDVTPQDKFVYFGRDDGKVRIFRRNDSIAYLQTGREFKAPATDSSKVVQRVGESQFQVPLLNFNLENWGNAPYAIGKDSITGENELLLIRGDEATFRLNHRTNLVEYRGTVFEEELGTIKYLPTPQKPQPQPAPTQTDLLQVEKVLK